MSKELFATCGRYTTMLVSLLLLAVATFAVPAKPGIKRFLTLSDGTTISATLVGDEYAHYWIGTDGKAYHAVGDNVYQSFDPTEALNNADKRRAAANGRRSRRLAPRRIGTISPVSGKKKGLIILVNFSDVAFQESNNQALFNDIANAQNFTQGKFKGSMSQYFRDQSDGQFQLTFDVVGPVTVSKPQAYYGENDPDYGDKHAAEMVIEALTKADEEENVNFANYDWNGDGTVEQVYVVYAGKGEADGGEDYTIWPHEYTLTEAQRINDGTGSQTLDGKTIDTYACGAELNGQTNSVAGIGTMCHEFSHCLGFPDFYDTKYSGGQGMGYWDLMSSGSYNGDGYQPAGYTSYERWMAGWKTPTTLTTTQTISNMAALQDEGSNTYIIYNKNNSNEYYLLENRQKVKWDASLPGEGLLILHVDYNAYAWTSNTPNNTPSHQRMTWIPADNEYQYILDEHGRKIYTFSGMKNDPFPYGSVNAFGKNTTPAATLYNKNTDGTKYLDCSLLNITQNSDGTVSFDFNAESNMVPVPPTIVADESLTFTTTIGIPQTLPLEVLSEGLTEDITLTLSDANGVFSLEATTIASTEEDATVNVTFTPTAVGDYSATITLTSAGAETVIVTLTATATPVSMPTLTISEVTDNSAVATWTACDNVTEYTLQLATDNLFTEDGSSPVTVLHADFSNTTGWTLSGTGTYTGTGYYGSGSPSIKFDTTGDYAISPKFGSGNKLQFWALGNNGSGSSFAISGLVNGSWQAIETVTIAKDAGTYEVDLPSGTSQVRFDFTKSVNCALDDVVVTSAGAVSLVATETVNGTSHTFTGLAPETTYYARVKGDDDWSAVKTFTTEKAKSAPVWAELPSTTIHVLENSVITLSDYVTGNPAPTITLTATNADASDYYYEDGDLLFIPSVAGTYTFTFTAENSEGSAETTLTIETIPDPVTVPELTISEVTSNSAVATWTACDNVTEYTLQLASDNQFTIGNSGSEVTLFSNDASNPSTVPDDWTYNIHNTSGNYLQLMSGNYIVTEAFDASTSTALSLSLQMRTYGGTTQPSVTVEYSTDNGTTWSESIGTISAENSTMKTFTLDVSDAKGHASVRLRIASTSTSSTIGVGIKSIVLTGMNMAAGSLIATETVSGTSHTFTGLTPETTYYVRVKGDEGWSDVEEFLTVAATQKLDLANNGANSEAIGEAAASGSLYDVTLSDRRLYKDSYWNTLYLPFNVTISDSPLAGAEARKLTGASIEGTTLTLTFSDPVSTLEAGTPYIIKWGNGDVLTDLVFNGVTVVSTDNSYDNRVSGDQRVRFIGTSDAITFNDETFTEDKSILFVDGENTLSWPEKGARIGACRAYFKIGEDGMPGRQLTAFVLNLGYGGETTGIIATPSDRGRMASDSWNSLDGIRLSSKPVKKGVYIHNGQKVVVK